MGLGQIYKANLEKFKVSVEAALDPCINLQLTEKILSDCFFRAKSTLKTDDYSSLKSAFSCYYSGNFKTGFQHGYVDKVLKNAAVPSIKHLSNPKSLESFFVGSLSSDSGLVF